MATLITNVANFVVTIRKFKMISDDEKSKLWWQFKRQVERVLEPFDCYGQKPLIDGAVEAITELALIAVKRYNGKDEPMLFEVAKERLSKRYAGKSRKL